jgi:hypothetical protein
MFVRVDIELKSKRGFEKGDTHVVIIVESMTIVSSIFGFQCELVHMFFHTYVFREFKKLYLELELYYHCCHHYSCKGEERITRVKNNDDCKLKWQI